MCYGFFEWSVMSFRLTNILAVFQHFMNNIFLDFLDMCVVIYLNNILIYFNDLSQH